ncbi:MAG: hypothetical protein V1929_08745 [bacterium]
METLEWNTGLVFGAGCASNTWTAAATAAEVTLTGNDKTVVVTKVQYRISVDTTQVGKVYEVKWTEQGTSAEGFFHRIERFAGNGGTKYTQTYTINPPASQGSITVRIDDPNASPAGDIEVSKSQLRADGGDHAIASVTLAGGQEMEWSLEGIDGHGDLGCQLGSPSVSGGKSYIMLTAGREAGFVALRAADKNNPACAEASAIIQIGTCEQCKNNGNCGPGSGEVKNGSVDIAILLGSTGNGDSAGSLLIKEDVPSPLLSTPYTLIYNVSVPDIDVVKSDGAIRQVNTPQALADVITNTDFSYEIRIYDAENVGSKVSGLYQPTGSPFTVWTFENPAQSLTNCNEFTAKKSVGSSTSVYTYTWSDTDRAWTLDEAGLRAVSKTGTVDEVAGNRTEVTEVKSGTNNVASRVTRMTHRFFWGETVTEERQEVSASGAPLVTKYDYYVSGAETGKFSKLKSVSNPDGSWIKYDYDTAGRQTTVIRSWKDMDIDLANVTNARVTEYSYDSVDTNDVPDARDGRARQIVEKIEGIVVAKSFSAYYTQSNGCRVEISERCSSQSADYGNTTNPRTTRIFYPITNALESADRPKSVQYPDGTLDSFTYEKGAYTASTNPASSLFTPGAGTDTCETVVHGVATNSAGIAFKTTKETVIRDAGGRVVLRETYVYDGSGYERIDWTVLEYDASFGRLVRTVHANGTEESATWDDCCGQASRTDAHGTVTLFEYDQLGRLLAETKDGTVDQPDIVTSYAFDAAGRQLSVTRRGR